MKKMSRREKFDKVILVSGDCDYKMLVDFLIEEKLLRKFYFQILNSHHLCIKKLALGFLTV